MAALLQIGLVNAALATLLACVVAIIARKVRRPALIHGLWIIVLAKLVMPPFFEVPVEVPYPLLSAMARTDEKAPDSTPSSRADLHEKRSARRTEGTRSRAEARGEVRTTAMTATDADASSPAVSAGMFSRLATTVSTAYAVWSAWLLRNIVLVLSWTWLGGAALWFLRQALTTLRYSRRLALATPAPAALQEQADGLARAMGLSYRPPVLFVRDVISPMLWGVGRNTRLLFPVDLLARLEPGARETLIAHELAHFRRGDHWVRAFELVVSGLFWWHPVVWWARREIEIAEEECCDAWVIEQFPATPRCYAEALLETIDFLSGEGSILPPAAAGLGHVPFLKRRLTAIMRGAAPKSLSTPARLALLVGAALLLPWQPGLTPAVAHSRFSPAPISLSDFNATKALQSVAEERQYPPGADDWPGPNMATIDKAIEPVPTVAEELPWASATSPDRLYRIARRGRESNVVLYDVLSDKSIDLSEYQILTVTFAPDSQTFATGSADGIARVWASSNGVVLHTLRGHSGSVQSVAFTHEGKVLVSVGRDGSLRLWNLELGADNERPAVFTKSTPINCLAVSPDGRWLAVGTGRWMMAKDGKANRGKVTVLDLETLAEHRDFDWDLGIGAVAFQSDSNTLVAGDWRGRAIFWDVDAGQCLGNTLARYKDAIAKAQFSPDSQALLEVQLKDVVQQPEYDDLPRGNFRVPFGESVNLNPFSDLSPQTNVVIPGASDDSVPLRSTPRRTPAVPFEPLN